MDQKPHWLVTELAAICVVVLVLFIALNWQQSTSYEGIKKSADHHYEEQDYEGALPLYKQLLADARSLRKHEDKDYAVMLNQYASCYYNLDRDKEAEPLLERALALQEKLFKPDDLKVADTLHKLAYCYMEDKHYQQAIALYERAIAIREKHHARTDLAYSLDGLAYVYFVQGKYQQAAELYDKASLNTNRQATDDDSVATLNYAAFSYYKLGQYDKAESFYKQVLDYRLRNENDGSQALDDAYYNMAVCLKAKGLNDELKELEAAAAARKCSIKLD
jgi:tetratricopeptide (TPR) repeat protein